ncbi:hypothetical protein PROFUN_08741 [Planoprotostelium fungivorum]|uniref:Uncharacterized protein n=1 Tax=Planoprotostelium fungivorum TaxID=1890364 RepID=A0A2P6ND44_9EUKA|nr:hypothetical protein PROFUN_08741 [Planoprotostelium fungivorum]
MSEENEVRAALSVGDRSQPCICTELVGSTQKRADGEVKSSKRADACTRETKMYALRVTKNAKDESYIYSKLKLIETPMLCARFELQTHNAIVYPSGSNTTSPASSENEEETPDETTSAVKSSVMDATADVASSQKIELASETPRGEMMSPPLESNFYPDDSLEDKDRPMASQQPSTEESQGDTSDSGTTEDDSEEVQYIDDTVETADHEPNEDNPSDDSATPAIPPDYLLPANNFRRTLRSPEWDPVSWVHHISIMQPHNSEYLYDRMTPIYQLLSVATGEVVGEDRHPSDMDFDHLLMVRTYLHFKRENLKEPAKVLHHQIGWIGSGLLQLQGSYREEQVEFLQVWRDAHLWLGAVQELERQM